MADLKITQLPENTTPNSADLLPLVDDPAGTPITQKITLGTVATWLAALSQTLTGKRITKRVVAVTSSATPSFNTDNGDIAQISALAVNITSMTSGLTGTPNTGDMKLWDITPTATRTITWGASFVNTAELTWPPSVTTRTLALGYWNGSAFMCVDIKSL